MTALHCADCDDYDCAGFTNRVTVTEPLPALRPTRVATDAERRAALAVIRADLAAAKDKGRGEGK